MFTNELDYQLQQKFGDQVSTFNLCCYHNQLAPFPAATCRSLITLAAKRLKLQSTLLLPSQMRKVAQGNTVILSPKFHHQTSVTPYSTH